MSKLNQIKIPLSLPIKIRVTKVTDEVFKGEHPNKINEGYTVEGEISELPLVGFSLYVSHGTRLFATSQITEIIDGNTFKTLNSTYKWEVINTELKSTT